tara:strand:+ start:50 stop:310 length:261 start_codon:yes stop_codon:yes gene_type:complete
MGSKKTGNEIREKIHSLRSNLNDNRQEWDGSLSAPSRMTMMAIKTLEWTLGERATVSYTLESQIVILSSLGSDLEILTDVQTERKD